MDIRERISINVTPKDLYPVLADLAEYPKWLSIVSRVRTDSAPPARQLGTADDSTFVDSDNHNDQQAWIVDLQGSIGPLRRSKRLRMVRSENIAETRIVFERAERDGKDHSPWKLTVDIEEVHAPGTAETRSSEPVANSSVVVVHLHYGGNLWVPLLGRILEDEIRSSAQRLRALIDSQSAG